MDVDELKKEIKSVKKYMKKAPRRLQKALGKRIQDLSTALRNEKRKKGKR
jgi:hypothetical protein